MTEATTVPIRLLRGYWPATGVKLAPGTQIEVEQAEADRLVEKGIGEIHVPVDPRVESSQFVDDVHATAKRMNGHTHYLYQRDFAGYADWCKANDEIALPACPEVVVRYCINRLHKDKVSVETILRSISGIAHTSGIYRGATGGDGTLGVNSRQLLRKVLSEAQQQHYDALIAARKASCYAVTPEQASHVAFEMVEAEAKKRLAQISGALEVWGKSKDKRNGRSAAA